MLKQVGDCLDILKYINETLTRMQFVELENICTTKHVWPDSTATTENPSGTCMYTVDPALNGHFILQ